MFPVMGRVRGRVSVKGHSRDKTITSMGSPHKDSKPDVRECVRARARVSVTERASEIEQVCVL